MKKLFAAFTLTTVVAGCAMDIESAGDHYAVQDPQPSATCPADSVCLEALALEEGALAKPGHLAVVWYQLESGDPDPKPEIAWSQEVKDFAHAEGGRLVIPLKTITKPTSPELLLCERESDDEAKSPCRGDIALGTATVVVADDLDESGKLDAFEVEKATRGRGRVVIVSSDHDYNVTPPAFTPVFADGVVRGTAAYGFVESGRGVRLARAERGASFELQICSGTTGACRPSFPDLGELR
jgi:hypothetical protein